LYHLIFGAKPSIQVLDLVRSLKHQEILDVLTVESGDIFSQVKRYVSDPFEEAIDELESEYANLFIGPESPKAPPWESVYIGTENLLFQESTLEVRHIYHECGFLPQEYPKVADDHIALMLDFMAHLSHQAEEAFDKKSYGQMKKVLKAQALFLENHLMNWITQFRDILVSKATLPFYPYLIEYAIAFFSLDQKSLADAYVLTQG